MRKRYKLWSSYEDRRYFTGFTGSAGWVLSCDEQQPLLCTDGRYAEQARLQCAGQAEVEIGELLDIVSTHIDPGSIVEFDPSMSYESVKLLQKNINAVFVASGAADRRAIKSEAEISHIKKACQIADQALEDTLAKFDIFETEIDFSRSLESRIYELGSAAIPFEFIVAQGPRSALPHGVASVAKLGKAPFTVDWGAESQGYFSDQTVTVVPDRSTYNEQWKEIYDVVYQAQQAGLAAISDGVLASDVDLAARNVIVAAGLGDFFTHSTGHGVGLAIHEFPGISNRSSSVLRSGMIITVEPGVYKPGFGGVRLEDTVLVTSDGHESLTQISKSEPIYLPVRQ